MSKIKVNGKDVSKKKALEMLEDDSTVVHQVGVTIPNKNKSKDTPLTDEGFDIPQDTVSQLCKAMDQVNASFAKITFTNSAKIKGRTLVVIMADADDPDLAKIMGEE